MTPVRFEHEAPRSRVKQSTHVLLYELMKKKNEKELKLKANVVHVRSCIFILKCILSFVS